MRMTKEQLLVAARTAAKYLPAASADIMTELANRLDVTSVALSESLEQRTNLAAHNIFMHDLLVRLSKERPGGCYFAKWDGLVAEAIKADVSLGVMKTLRAEGVLALADWASTANNGHEINPDIEEIRRFAEQIIAGKWEATSNGR